MRKYDDVDVAVWVAAVTMTYNSYIEGIKNNDISINKFYFTQSEIITKSKEICTKDVQSPRVGQWYNGDHINNTYNYLRAKGKLRRVTCIGEFNGEKEYPNKLSKEDIIDTIDGSKQIKEILDFLSNEYKEIITYYEKNELKEILNFETELEKEDDIQMSLNKNNNPKNIILYGPPGTGKTYNVCNKALEIIDYEKYKNI